MADRTLCLVMIIVGLIIGLMISFGEIVWVAIFQLLLRFSLLFLNCAGIHETNIRYIGALMSLAALVHTVLNTLVYHERMNEFSWAGMGLGVIGSMIMNIGTS